MTKQTDRDRAAHDAMRQYTLETLIQNPPKRRELYPLDAETVTAYWISAEWGCEMWIDDPASIGFNISEEG